MKKLIIPAVLTSAVLFSACLPEETVVVSPSAIERNILSLDYEAPTHTAGGLPQFGFFPNKTSDSWTNKQSIVAGSAAAMSTQSLEMLTGTYTSHALGVAAKKYDIAFELKTVDITSLTSVRVFFDYGVSNTHAIQLKHDGSVLFNSQNISSFVAGDVVRMAVSINIEDQEIAIKVNDNDIQYHPMAASLEDLHNLRFYISGGSGKLYVDNVTVNAEFPLEHQPADTADGFYSLEFEEFDHAKAPYNTHEKGFSLTSGMKRSPGDNNVPDNGSKHCGYAASTKPLLFHQFGYPFSLHAIDIAQYSSVYRSPQISITGYKMDGSSISKIIDQSELSMSFATFNFNAQWSNLRYVAFSDAASMDNLKLSIDDSSTVGFFPLP